MSIILVVIFALAYLAIALEQPLRINKSAAALVGAGLLWTVYALASPDAAAVADELAESVAVTARIVFFLMGAMAIVEVIDAHDGFEIVTARIRTGRLSALIWLIGLTTFVLSAILDNLTTTIVMVSLLPKLLERREDRMVFAGLIVIAANAGGAWSPIGDVTTTMLWIGGQLTAAAVIGGVLLASLVNLAVPLLWASLRARGRPFARAAAPAQASPTSALDRNIMFGLGLGILILVPAFKAATHLPPFMGILFGLGILWTVGDILHRNKPAGERDRLTLAQALQRIDLSSLVFFIGILLAVAALEHAGLLTVLAAWLERLVGRQDAIVFALGLISAVVDNVPLVAATMGMYPLDQYWPDSFLWHFIAYCAGTGGSILVIGSAAGVAAMGIEQLPFGWYMRKIGSLALAGYCAGALVFVVQYRLLH